MRNFLLRYKSYIFLLLLILLTLRVLLPQLEGLKDSLQALKTADPYLIALAVIIFFAGVPLLAMQVMALALNPLRFLMTLKVEMATLFVSKLLPSALGTISLNMYYLTKNNHTTSQAATVMTMNAITSGIAYAGLVIYAIANTTINLDNASISVNISGNLILLLIILVLGAAYKLYRSIAFRRRLSQTYKNLKKDLKAYKKKPSSFFSAIICNGLGSAANIVVLVLSAKAVGLDLSFGEALLAYTFGNIATTLIPTPGGIGAAEAGIYAGLVLVGMGGPDAIMVTLLYRLITYWLPIIPGYYFFWGLRKNILSNFSLKRNYA